MTTNAKGEDEQFCENIQDLLELTSKKDVIFTVGDWDAKVGNQEIHRISGKFGLGVKNEAGQRLTVLTRELAGHGKHPFQQPKR